jgi:Leucine-rich repeat (LRR) protein
MEVAPLFLEDGKFEFLPDLSNIQSQSINLNKNQISTIFIEYIPRICKVLLLERNRIHSDGLPFEWHVGIRTISLAENYLFDTEGVEWPICLENLNLSKNPLRAWPEGLPQGLHVLNLSHTFLKRVEFLPDHLQVLNISSSGVSQLPTALPQTLQILDLHTNYLRNSRLPFDWGESLRVLDLENNCLIKVPENLPDSLEVLRLSNNRILEIPKNLPANLKVLLLDGNKVRTVHYEKRKHPIQFLSLNDNELTESVRDYQEKHTLLFAEQVREENNWCQPHHTQAAQKIRRSWKLYKFRKCLRTLSKTLRVREELFQVSMHPCRAGRFENISSDWGWGC